MDYALLESLTFVLSGQYTPKDGVWTMTFLAPTPQFKLHSYAVGIKTGSPDIHPTTREMLLAATNVPSKVSYEL